jgi:hypothetical protein
VVDVLGIPITVLAWSRRCVFVSNHFGGSGINLCVHQDHRNSTKVVDVLERPITVLAWPRRCVFVSNHFGGSKISDDLTQAGGNRGPQRFESSDLSRSTKRKVLSRLPPCWRAIFHEMLSRFQASRAGRNAGSNLPT